MPGKHVQFSPHDTVHILPPIPPSSVLNPVLVFSPTPAVQNNVALPTTLITLNNAPLGASVLADFAVYPAVPRLTIKCPAFTELRLSHWAMDISAPAGGFVTVAHVLSGIHSHLHSNVKADEYNSLPAVMQKLVTAAYIQRCCACGKTPKEIEQEKAKGLKRVDFLASRTQWCGLVETPNPAVCEIYFT